MKFFFNFYFYLVLVILWTNCRNNATPPWSEQLLVLDPSALYQRQHRSIIDSLFLNHQNQLDSLWEAEVYASDSMAGCYFKLRYLSAQLNKGNLALVDKFLISYPDALFSSLGEFSVKYALIKARLWGEQRRLAEADSLFDYTQSLANRYVKDGHELTLQIINARIIMWRYVANDAHKALELLYKMDSMLMVRPDFTRYHRDYFYTLATTYRILGKLDEALSSALILREKLTNEFVRDSVYLMALSKVIGNIYTDIGDPLQAGQFFREQIDYNLLHQKLNAHDLLNFAIQLALYEDLSTAKDYIQKSEPLLNTQEDSFHYHRVSAFYLMKNEHYAQARVHLDKTINYLHHHSDQHLYPIMLTWLGEWYDLNHFSDSALTVYSQAISYRCGHKKLPEIILEDLRGLDDIELIYSLLIRALIHSYESTKEKSFLDQAITYTSLIERYFETIALSYEGINRIINFQYFHEAFGYGAHAHFIKYGLTADSLHLRKCLQLLEKCKSYEWDIFNSVQDMQLSASEKKVINGYSAFRQKIAELEYQTETFKTTTVVNSLQNLITQRDQWVQEIKDSFPRLHRLFQVPGQNIDFHQLSQFTDSATLIYFHWNRLRTYFYTFTSGNIKIAYYENKKGLNDSINTYLNLLRNRGLIDYPEELERSFSHSLWNKWNIHLDPTVKNLVIIPDGPVHNLAFSALHTDLLSEYQVGNDYQVTYSFNLKSALKPHEEPKLNSILAMAYGKSTEKEIYASLPGTIKEVETMLTDWKGKKVHFFKNEEVTKENFMKHAPSVDVIYLATHAVSDPYNRFRNHLVFHGKDGRNEYVSTSDLLNIEIKTKKIVLSACNSGIIRLYRGTNFSLLYYFNTIGAWIESQITPINDTKTKENNNYTILYR